MKSKIILAVAVALAGVFPAFAQDTATWPNPTLTTAGAPSAGTSEVQTLTFSGTITGGTFRLGFQGKTTPAVSWSSTNAVLVSNIDTALEALPTIGTGGVTTATGSMTSGTGTITVTFAGNLAKMSVATLSVTSSLTGTATPLVSNAETTPGVTADGRKSPSGTLLIDSTNRKLYINTGTVPLNPIWTVAGSQS